MWQWVDASCCFFRDCSSTLLLLSYQICPTRCLSPPRPSLSQPCQPLCSRRCHAASLHWINCSSGCATKQKIKPIQLKFKYTYIYIFLAGWFPGCDVEHKSILAGLGHGDRNFEIPPSCRDAAWLQSPDQSQNWKQAATQSSGSRT